MRELFVYDKTWVSYSLLVFYTNHWCSAISRILGDCLLISSLPEKAVRTLLDIARLAERFNNMCSLSRAW